MLYHSISQITARDSSKKPVGPVPKHQMVSAGPTRTFETTHMHQHRGTLIKSTMERRRSVSSVQASAVSRLTERANRHTRCRTIHLVGFVEISLLLKSYKIGMQ